MIAPKNDLPPAFVARVDELVSHYPVSKRSASLMLLHEWQENFGYISEEAVDWIARRLEIQTINVYELVTFYPMFRREPFGKCHVRVCRTLSCALAGCHKTHADFVKATGAQGDPHGPMHSPDGKFTVEYVECLASCGTGPVVMMNDDFYENIEGAKIADLVKKYAE